MKRCHSKSTILVRGRLIWASATIQGSLWYILFERKSIISNHIFRVDWVMLCSFLFVLVVISLFQGLWFFFELTSSLLHHGVIISLYTRIPYFYFRYAKLLNIPLYCLSISDPLIFCTCLALFTFVSAIFPNICIHSTWPDFLSFRWIRRPCTYNGISLSPFSPSHAASQPDPVP